MQFIKLACEILFQVQNIQIQPNTATTLNGQQTQQVRLVQTVNPTSSVNVTSPQQQGATVLTGKKLSISWGWVVSK